MISSNSVPVFVHKRDISRDVIQYETAFGFQVTDGVITTDGVELTGKQLTGPACLAVRLLVTGLQIERPAVSVPQALRHTHRAVLHSEGLDDVASDDVVLQSLAGEEPLLHALRAVGPRLQLH